jgi:hypothetical protein
MTDSVDGGTTPVGTTQPGLEQLQPPLALARQMALLDEEWELAVVWRSIEV